MAIVTRRYIREPSNSKCPGATRHLSIGDQKFSVPSIMRATGEAAAYLPEGPAVVKVGGTYAIGKQGKTQRHELEVPVVVTGLSTDTLTVCLDEGVSQPIEVLLVGVVAAPAGGKAS